MSENNDTSNDSNSLSGSSLLQFSRQAGTSNPLIRGGVLRPSVLGRSVPGSSLSTNNFTLAAGASYGNDTKKEIAKNPFLKEQSDEDDNDDGACSTKTIEKKNIKEELDERIDPLNLLRKNGIEHVNMFHAAKNSMPRVESSGFIFGQNVHERVDNITAENNNMNTETSNSTGNNTSELLFSSAIAAQSTENSEGVAVANNQEAETKSLTEVAREYQQSRAQKRKYEAVETFTGEENEINIVDMNCKFFAFENSNWEERGRGSLRLNDSKNESECSRVVFRTAGNLRLLLNTKVWAGMVAQRPSQKSLRLTAMDNTGKIKVFLAMARPVDVGQLYKALVERIENRKLTHPEECVEIKGNNDDGMTKNGDDLDVATTSNAVIETSEASSVDDGIDDDEPEATANLTEPEIDETNEPNSKKTVIVAANASNETITSAEPVQEN